MRLWLARRRRDNRTMGRGLQCLVGAALVASCRYSFDLHDSVVATFGSLGDENVTVVSRTRDGNVLLGGQFRGTVDFGCGALTSAGGADSFVVELTPKLACVRTWVVGGTGDDLVTDLSLDPLDNLVVVGEFRLTATMATGPVLTATFTRDIFLTKLTPTWQDAWTRQLPGNDADQTYDLIDHVRADSNGNIHVCGRVWGMVTFGWNGPVQTFTDVGWGDVFVLNVTANGDYVGADTFGGGGSDHPFATAVDAQDNLYVGRAYRGTVDFDPGPGMLSRSGNFDAYIEKRPPDGSTLVWAQVTENSGWRPYNSFAPKAGDQFAAVQADMFSLSPSIVLKTISFNTADGSVAWSRDIPAALAYPTAVATDADGNVYSGGRFQDSVDFAPQDGGDVRTANGIADGYIQRYDADGTLRWTDTFGGAGSDNVTGLTALGPDDVVVVGTF